MPPLKPTIDCVSIVAADQVIKSNERKAFKGSSWRAPHPKEGAPS